MCLLGRRSLCGVGVANGGRPVRVLVGWGETGEAEERLGRPGRGSGKAGEILGWIWRVWGSQGESGKAGERLGRPGRDWGGQGEGVGRLGRDWEG